MLFLIHSSTTVFLQLHYCCTYHENSCSQKKSKLCIPLYIYLIVFIQFILSKGFYYFHTGDFIFFNYRVHIYLIPLSPLIFSFPPTSLLTPLHMLLTMPSPITLLIRTTVLLHFLFYIYFFIPTFLLTLLTSLFLII